MAQILRQSTAYTFRFGPFLDETDGKTAETALTIAAGDIYLSKAGGAFAAKNDATALTGTGDARGYYTCVLNTTDINTLGNFRVHAHIPGALPVWQDFTVLPAQVYDSLIAGTEFLETSPFAQKFGISGSDLTHYARDGVTTQGTATLASAAVNPVVSSSGG